MNMTLENDYHMQFPVPEAGGEKSYNTIWPFVLTGDLLLEGNQVQLSFCFQSSEGRSLRSTNDYPKFSKLQAIMHYKEVRTACLLPRDSSQPCFSLFGKISLWLFLHHDSQQNLNRTLKTGWFLYLKKFHFSILVIIRTQQEALQSNCLVLCTNKTLHYECGFVELPRMKRSENGSGFAEY